MLEKLHQPPADVCIHHSSNMRRRPVAQVTQRPARVADEKKKKERMYAQFREKHRGEQRIGEGGGEGLCAHIRCCMGGGGEGGGGGR